MEKLQDHKMCQNITLNVHGDTLKCPSFLPFILNQGCVSSTFVLRHPRPLPEPASTLRRPSRNQHRPLEGARQLLRRRHQHRDGRGPPGFAMHHVHLHQGGAHLPVAQDR
jgi:hypothetical protein